MKNKDYSYFETTADIGIEVYSDSLENAFINSALATMNLVTDVDKIKEKITNKINIESEDEYALLYDWITELMILMNSEYFIASSYNMIITKCEDTYKLDATAVGDIYDTDVYNYKTEVKAITYHQMLIEDIDDNIHIKFIVDI